MSTKYYQRFTIEKYGENILVLSRNVSYFLQITWILGGLMLIFSLLFLFFSTRSGAVVGSFFSFLVSVALFFNALIKAGEKKEYIFDKAKNLILLNSKALFRIDQVSHIEFYRFIADEDTIETYRVIIVIEMHNRKHKIDEAQDEYDLKALTRELSTFLSVPILDTRDPSL